MNYLVLLFIALFLVGCEGEAQIAAQKDEGGQVWITIPDHMRQCQLDSDCRWIVSRCGGGATCWDKGINQSYEVPFNKEKERLCKDNEVLSRCKFFNRNLKCINNYCEVEYSK